MPVDILWLDIEYLKDHQHMIWDKKNFPDPVEMTNDVAALGCKVSCHRLLPIKSCSSFPTVLSLDGRDCGPTLEACR
jgi:alpha 1,3-glucosidase